MKAPVINIDFDRTKGPSIDFDILPFEHILKRKDLGHDPKVPHRVHFYLLILITSGTIKHTIDFKEYVLSKGSVLSIRKNQIQGFHNGEAKGFILLFTEEYVLSYLDKSGVDKISEFFNELIYDQHTMLDKNELDDVLNLTHHIQIEYERSLDVHTSGIIRNLLQVLVSKVARIRSVTSHIAQDHKYTDTFLKFQQLIESDNRQSRSVKYYAKALGLSTKTLNNATRHIVKKPAKQFLDDIIILKIKRLLINSNLSIKEIAYQSGFNEPTNLFKFFKRSTGQTPENFRAQYAT